MTSSPPRPWFVRLHESRATLFARWIGLHEMTRDALLYSVSSAFALGMGLTSGESAQWRWGYLTCIPYAVAALIAFATMNIAFLRAHVTRLVLLTLVIVSCVAIPLGLETHWRQLDGAGYAQPEVSVIERSGQALSEGKSPYTSFYQNGHIVHELRGVPAYESFFPYFPLMGVFGLPSADTHLGKGLTDARLVMSLMTLGVSLLALRLLRITREHKVRVAQVLLALPTGALFLATGGDDMPILALILLGVAALQRRQTAVAGIALGLGAAMKLTAWPLALGSLLVGTNKEGGRSWRHLLAWIGGIVTVTVVPFIFKNPRAFLSNVVAFPLGLAHVNSPAASPLPGHILTTLWPPLGHVLAPLACLIGGYFATRYVRAHWPLRLTQLLGVLSLLSLLLICAASATRIGYVIYPLNLGLWAVMCRDAEDRELV